MARAMTGPTCEESRRCGGLDTVEIGKLLSHVEDLRSRWRGRCPGLWRSDRDMYIN